MLRKGKRTLARYINLFNSNDERGRGENVIFKQERAKIVQLPDELLLLIKSFLSLTSQACLTLTCRFFFIFTGAILDSREFDLSSMESIKKENVHGEWLIGYSLRWELLCLLEDARWLICPGCIKLHPANTFASHSRATEFRTSRECFYGPGTGIVEICPCIRLTFGDKLKLVAQLESSEKKAPGTENSESFWHECLAVRGTETVLIQAQPSLQENGNLVFQMRYEVGRDVGPSASLLLYMPIFTCCKRTINETIFYLSRPQCIDCVACETSSDNFTLVGNADKSYYKFETTRNLENGRKRVNSTWSRQRSVSFVFFLAYEGERWRRENQRSKSFEAVWLNWQYHSRGTYNYLHVSTASICVLQISFFQTLAFTFASIFAYMNLSEKSIIQSKIE